MGNRVARYPLTFDGATGCDQPCAPERSVRSPGRSSLANVAFLSAFRFSRKVASLNGRGVLQARHCEEAESFAAWQFGHSLVAGAMGQCFFSFLH